MEIFLIVVFISFVLAIVLLIAKLLRNNPFENKSSIVKKSEIIDGYKKSLDKLSNKDEKNQLLKQINNELAMNIFFDQDELRKTMQDLVAHSMK